ncbi:helix-turn-helix domain-containing protein [Flavobacterium sp. ZS1P14]|uniref:helix-turn-helix domain-containing protein n=1 Tax=Flavobacterium sp. ZS1P14 TaxID=3401729 RepID=UPI003AAD0D67
MIKDLISMDLGTSPVPGLTIHILKEYEIKTPANESFKVNNFSIMLIKSGELKIQMKDDSIHYLFPKDIIVLPKNSFCTLLEVKQKLRLFLISFTAEYASRNTIVRGETDPFYFFISKTTSKITLEDRDFLKLTRIYKLIYTINAEPENAVFKRRPEVVCLNLFRYGLELLCAKYKKDMIINFTRKELLVIKFLTMLTTDCKKQHSVKFYADMLFVTSLLLTKSVKLVTEKTAKELIVEAIIFEAKKLLDNSELTIYYIANELEFSTVSFFSNFFKKHASISPSDYRANSRKV